MTIGERIYKLTEKLSVSAPETCCLFCEWCTDVWWDYTNGPYMFYCVGNKDTSKGALGKCEHFKEEHKDRIREKG